MNKYGWEYYLLFVGLISAPHHTPLSNGLFLGTSSGINHTLQICRFTAVWTAYYRAKSSQLYQNNKNDLNEWKKQLFFFLQNFLYLRHIPQTLNKNGVKFYAGKWSSQAMKTKMKASDSNCLFVLVFFFFFHHRGCCLEHYKFKSCFDRVDVVVCKPLPTVTRPHYVDSSCLY